MLVCEPACRVQQHHLGRADRGATAAQVAMIMVVGLNQSRPAAAAMLLCFGRSSTRHMQLVIDLFLSHKSNIGYVRRACLRWQPYCEEEPVRCCWACMLHHSMTSPQGAQVHTQIIICYQDAHFTLCMRSTSSAGVLVYSTVMAPGQRRTLQHIARLRGSRRSNDISACTKAACTYTRIYNEAYGVPCPLPRHDHGHVDGGSPTVAVPRPYASRRASSSL